MDPDQINSLAELTSGHPDQRERGNLLKRTASDRESMRVLSAMHLPECEQSEVPDLPFPTIAVWRLGIDSGFFRPLDLEGTRLVKELDRIAKAVHRVSGGSLCACFGKAIEIDSPISSLPGRFQIAHLEDLPNLRLKIHFSKEGRKETGHLEVWEDGNLSRAMPVAKMGDHFGFGLDLGSAYAIRISTDSAGIGLRVSEVTFTPQEWIAACLTCAMEGDFSGALCLFREKLGDRFGKSRKVEAVKRWFDLLPSLVSFQSGSLIPVPATRAIEYGEATRQTAFRLVWDGIVTCWPQAQALPNPWGPISHEEPQTSPLPTEVFTLAQSAIEAAEGVCGKATPPGQTEDPRIRAGWSALKGWERLLAEDYEESDRAFLVAASLEGDPFRAKTAAALARHLQKTGDAAGSIEESRDTNDEVWREVFRPLL